MTPHPASRRRSEQGGITILTTLGLLVLLTVMVFSLGKSSLRELTTTGTVWQSAKASEAAEAGLDWFILWSIPNNAASATGYSRDTLVSAIQALNTGTTWSDPTINPHLLNPANPWDRADSITSTPSATGSDMVFANSGTGALQGGSVVQSFDLMFRYLGVPLINTVSSGLGNPSGPGTGTGRQAVLYQLQSTGKASIPTGSNAYMTYRATREMYLTVIP